MTLDSYPFGLLLVPGCVAAALGGLALMRRSLHRRSDLSRIHDVASSLYAIVGTLYAVILGLIVVDSMNKFSEARATTEAESNALADVTLLASQLPGEGPKRVRALADDYVRSAIRTEWPSMARRRPDPDTRRIATDLWLAVLSFEPQTAREQEVFSKQMDAAADFWNNRRTRLMIALQGGLPTMEWAVLIVGGVVTVSFSYFFKVDRFRLQMVMTGLLAVVIALNLYLVLMFASPFSGDVTVRPEGFAMSAYAHDHAPPPAPSSSR